MSPVNTGDGIRVKVKWGPKYKKVLQGIKRLDADLKRQAMSGSGSLTKVLEVGADDIIAEVLRRIDASPPDLSKPRKRQQKSGPGQFHYPSFPGNPPRRDFGQMVISIVQEVRPLEVEVGSEQLDPPYPATLEKGDPKLGIEARPWLQPVLDDLIPRIEDNLYNTFKRDFEKALGV